MPFIWTSPPVVLMCDEAVTVVAAIVLAELAPIAVPSIAPPLISTVVKVEVPAQVMLFSVAKLELLRVVKLPGAAVLPPIVVLSIVPPSQSIVPFISNVPPIVRVFPEPTFNPTEVPSPLAAKIPSTASRSLLILPPQVFVEAPTSAVSYTHLRAHET